MARDPPTQPLIRAVAYVAAISFGLVLAAIVAYLFGTLGAFLVGVVFIGLGVLLLLSDADAIPMTAAVAYFLGLAAVSGWIPLPSTALWVKSQPGIVIQPEPR